MSETLIHEGPNKPSNGKLAANYRLLFATMALAAIASGCDTSTPGNLPSSAALSISQNPVDLKGSLINTQNQKSDPEVDNDKLKYTAFTVVPPQNINSNNIDQFLNDWFQAVILVFKGIDPELADFLEKNATPAIATGPGETHFLKHLSGTYSFQLMLVPSFQAENFNGNIAFVSRGGDIAAVPAEFKTQEWLAVILKSVLSLLIDQRVNGNYPQDQEGQMVQIAKSKAEQAELLKKINPEAYKTLISQGLELMARKASIQEIELMIINNYSLYKGDFTDFEHKLAIEACVSAILLEYVRKEGLPDTAIFDRKIPVSDMGEPI